LIGDWNQKALEIDSRHHLTDIYHAQHIHCSWAHMCQTQQWRSVRTSQDNSTTKLRFWLQNRHNHDTSCCKQQQNQSSYNASGESVTTWI
jgi:hypothetical protein